MLPLTNANLPLANFDIFNQTYSSEFWDCCPKCLGSGGFVGYEYQGDYPQGGMVDTFAVCEGCIGQELCPGCMQPLALSFDVSAFYAPDHYHSPTSSSWIWEYSFEQALGDMPTDSFICLV